MSSFDKLVKSFDCIPCSKPNNCSSLGKSFYVDNDFYKGSYWYYESEDFIIDIHNFFIKKDYVINSTIDLSPYVSLISSYIVSGSGEWFNPYQNMSSNTILIMDTSTKNLHYILHGNSRFFLIGVKFKKTMLEKCIIKKTQIDESEISQIFLDTRSFITTPLSKLSKEIYSCKMTGASAELFFEAKAKEWLSITLDSYIHKKKNRQIDKDDRTSIENVAKYIDDHYSFDIPQEVLEKIAMMSGTKLKSSFKKRYNMTITEYTQRKRISFAENLLLTTDLKIKDIAKSVGYNSSSRFTTLFKRYKGCNPSTIRKSIHMDIDST